MKPVLEFGPFRLNSGSGALHRDGAPVPLGQRASALLLALVERRDQVVSKDDLLQAAWPGQVMSESNLTVQIAAVRQALGEDEGGQGWIVTRARHGYSFAGAVRESASPPIAPGPASSDRPSIAVLPFDNMSGDPGQAYFSDGITHDIISALSKFAGLMVIAGASSFRYRGSVTDLPRLVQDLGVDYVLEGGVRRGESRIRIGVRLIDAMTGAHLWADTYEPALGDLFAVQDEVSERVVSLLIAYVARAEQKRIQRKLPGSWRAYDHYLRGIDLGRVWDSPSYLACRQMMERAITADPGFAPAYPELAHTYVRAWIEPRDPQFLHPDALELAHTAACQALDLDPLLASAHAVLGWVLFWRREHDRSIGAFERAIEINPNLSEWRYGHVLAHSGRAGEGLVALRRAMRLDPFLPPRWRHSLGHAYLMLRRDDEALGMLREIAGKVPRFWPCHVYLAAACGRLGLLDEAQLAFAAIRAVEPDFTIRTWGQMASYRNPEDLAYLLDSLRMAGIAE
jgi:TolB-like protein